MPPGEEPSTKASARNTRSAGPNRRRSLPPKPRSGLRTAARKPVSAPCSTNSEEEKGRYSSIEPRKRRHRSRDRGGDCAASFGRDDFLIVSRTVDQASEIGDEGAGDRAMNPCSTLLYPFIIGMAFDNVVVFNIFKIPQAMVVSKNN